MIADVVAGVVDGITVLVQFLVDLILLFVEFVVEAVFLIAELVVSLFIHRREHYERPAWVQARREKRGSPLAKLLLVGIVALGFAAFYYGRTEIHFQHGTFLRPTNVQVILTKGERTEATTIEKAKLTLLRGRWDRLEVRDERYLTAIHEISGRKMHIWLDRAPTLRNAVADAVVAEGLNRFKGMFVEGGEKKKAEKK